jgi:hypothetical protein
LEVALKAAKVGLVPHSNQADVATPFGFTPPFTVALLNVIELAGFVDAFGANRGDMAVKLRIDPFTIPAELEAATRK